MMNVHTWFGGGAVSKFPAGRGGRVVGLTSPPTSSAEVLERVELYLNSPKGPSWPIKRVKRTVSKLYAVFPDVSRTKSDRSTTLQTAVKTCGHKHECVGDMGRRGLL